MGKPLLGTSVGRLFRRSPGEKGNENSGLRGRRGELLGVITVLFNQYKLTNCSSKNECQLNEQYLWLVCMWVFHMLGMPPHGGEERRHGEERADGPESSEGLK